MTFINIFTNAIQAMEGAGELSIKAEEKGMESVIYVKDTGKGMSKEVREHIFDPLFTTKAKGIGLGMAIVKDIVTRHKGKIEVESVEGKGTTFKIVLPRHSEET